MDVPLQPMPNHLLIMKLPYFWWNMVLTFSEHLNGSIDYPVDIFGPGVVISPSTTRYAVNLPS